MVRIVRLGTPRHPDEGLRIGTVRRPPRGVPKAEFSKRDFYDVWLPVIAPSQELVSMALGSKDSKTWNTYVRKFRAELKGPEASRVLDLLAALSHQTNFSVGCYCKNEARCHRGILREELAARGAMIG